MSNRPSTLYRSYLCPGSARLVEKVLREQNLVQWEYPEEVKEYTKKGHLYHDITKRKLKGEPQEEPVVLTDEDTELINYCYVKVKEISEQGGINLYEFTLPMLEIKMNKGTADYINVRGPGIILVDYKFGDQFVDGPKWNWQLKCYAVAAWNMFGGDWVKVVICQPKLLEEDRWREYTFQVEELREIQSKIIEIVDKTENPNAPLVPGQKQCQWCGARDHCPVRKEMVSSIPFHLDFANHYMGLSPVEKGNFYEKVLVVLDWADKAKDKIRDLTINHDVPMEGFEIAPGKKMKHWKDIQDLDAALTVLFHEFGCDPAGIYKMSSPSEIQKILGRSKKVQAILDPYVEYREGNKVLKKINKGEPNVQHVTKKTDS